MANNKKADRIMKGFGHRLRAVRIASGYLTAEDFARDLGVTSPRYRKYERGDIMPPVDVLEMICNMTGKTLDFLVLGR